MPCVTTRNTVILCPCPAEILEMRCAKVPLPYMYAEVGDVELHPEKHIFNCTQRAHQNTLEMYPGFLFLLSLSGIQYPLYSGIFGAVWILGRIIFAVSYISGDPEKRFRGIFGQLGLLALLALSITTLVDFARYA
ncbi:hypothetical protein BASA62_007497 [Batrachochytrium salamandrivorans]|nr:hypothetical protein BASA62_007497 [Batrachochytrium salamandrivorans]